MRRSVLLGFVVATFTAALAPAQAPLALSQLKEYTVQNLTVPEEPGAPFEVGAVLGGLPQRLTLSPHSVRAENFRAVVDDGTGVPREVQPPAPATYQGTVEGLAGVRVAASIIGGGMHAILDAPELGGYWSIEPLSVYQPGAPRQAHVVYPMDALPPNMGVCGWTDDGHARPAPPRGGGFVDNALNCQLAIDTDFEFYQANGSNQTNCINDIELVINGCDVIYRRDVNVTFTIVHTIIRSNSSDPYTTNNPHSLLDQVAAHWFSQQGGVARDLVHHMSGRDFDTNVIGVAFLNGVCSTSIGYGTVQRPGLSSGARVGLSAHEMGHNFAAVHCDAQPDCRIMCSGLGGCTGNLSSFGAFEQSQIETFAANARCLTPETLELPFEEPWAEPSINRTKWPDLVGATLSSAGVNIPSPPRTLLLNFATNIASDRINVPNAQFFTGVYLSYWTQHRGVEAGEQLRVEYFSTIFNRWELVEDVTSDGIDQTQFIPGELELPAGAFGTGFRLRFSTSGNDAFDSWYVDDVYVGEFCLADVDRSRTLDVFDFLEFQNLYAAQDRRGDWNHDGFFDIFDFLAYQNAFAAGCY